MVQSGQNGASGFIF